MGNGSQCSIAHCSAVMESLFKFWLAKNVLPRFTIQLRRNYFEHTLREKSLTWKMPIIEHKLDQKSKWMILGLAVAAMLLGTGGQKLGGGGGIGRIRFVDAAHTAAYGFKTSGVKKLGFTIFTDVKTRHVCNDQFGLGRRY
jgi:hypothetical protein